MTLIPFVLIAVLHLLGAAFNLETVLFTKPLLMPSLAWWWWNQSKGSLLRNSVMGALVCSTLGDILLMGADCDSRFFLAGLASFLVAHIFYILSFRHLLTGPKGYLARNPQWILLFVAYLAGLLWWLWPGIPANMKGAVFVYASVITTMAMLALHLRGLIPAQAANWLFLGAVLFVLSDSMIAINKFGHPFAEARVAIISTYIIGQYGIVRALGVARQRAA